MNTNWLRRLLGDRDSLPSAGRRRPSFRPYLENLESRLVPAIMPTDLTTGLTPTNLVQTLVGTGVTFSNVTYKGTNTSSAKFTGGMPSIGFDAGIILSTGLADSVVGPNKSTGTSKGLGTPGDTDLDAIIAPAKTNDATVLEFDFVPKGTVLKFNFVFGSDEYNEFVSSFNDVFAFFLNNKNVALLPGTNTPVSIKNVNLNTNSQFFRNNALPGDVSPATPPLLDIECDGLTTVLTVTASVNPNVTNHIKLAIADAVELA
ncbi:MAG TPA: hypothetical protein DDY78_04740, partial [Planctomycetales bacterium]|nr:hypothetical protein [Planctomycetales bacterium]